MLLSGSKASYLGAPVLAGWPLHPGAGVHFTLCPFRESSIDTVAAGCVYVRANICHSVDGFATWLTISALFSHDGSGNGLSLGVVWLFTGGGLPRYSFLLNVCLSCRFWPMYGVHQSISRVNSPQIPGEGSLNTSVNSSIFPIDGTLLWPMLDYFRLHCWSIRMLYLYPDYVLLHLSN